MKTILFAASVLAAAPAIALDHVPLVAKIIDGGVRADITAPAVLAMLREQNARNATLDQAGIDAADKAWRAEVAAGGGSLISATLGNTASAYLKEVRAKHQGLLTEIIVMDSLGLNVAQSDLTSDYWQGDEAKFQKSYGAGASGVFIDEVELDESTQTMQSQASFTIVDPQTGLAIGAATIGVDVEQLAN
jgi:hypothetical protein